MQEWKKIAAYVFAALAAVVLFASGAFWASHKGRLDSVEAAIASEAKSRMEADEKLDERLKTLEHRLGRGQGSQAP